MLAILQNRHCRCAALLLCTTLLSACVSQSDRDPQASQWLLHQQQIAGLEFWEFNGKVAFSTPDAAESARVHWLQQGPESRVTLSGPVGWSRATIISNGTKLELLRDGQTQTLAADDSTALEQQLGWPLPAKLLPWWVRGIPDPSLSVDAQTMDLGRLQQLQQGGWQVDFDSYQRSGDYTLPAKIRLSRAGVSGKIILRQWKLGADAQ